MAFPNPDSEHTIENQSFFRSEISQGILSQTQDSDIDMQREMSDFCHQHGHWIIVRKFDRTRRSRFWDERSQSAIGGPAWEYEDIFVKSIYSREGLGILPTHATRTIRLGQMDNKDYVYYIPHYITPTDRDLIIDIEPCVGPKPRYYKIRQARKIARVDTMRDRWGRVEFHQVVVLDETPTGDETLM